MDSENKFKPYFYPILASRGDESLDFILAKWNKFDTLSKINQNKIDSKKTAETIEKIYRKFNLTLEQISILSIIVRDFYFEKIQLPDFPALFCKELEIPMDTAEEISQIVVQYIINDTSFEKDYQAQTEKLPLLKALEKYPEIEEQLITSNRIKIVSFASPVRPSIKNWLSDYNFIVGPSNQDAVIRGKYLFKSENAGQLSNQDREKLALILKSFEEQTPLVVNNKLRQIIFPVVPEKSINLTRPIITPHTVSYNNLEAAQTQKNATPSFQSDNDRLSAWRKDLPKKETLEKITTTPPPNKIHFSSPQTFSVEKNIPDSIKNYPATGLKQELNTLPSRQIPKNVINLKEN